MADIWNEEPTEEETVRILGALAEKVRRRGLQTPAILALEMHKPLASFAGCSAIALAPFLVPLFGYDRVHEATRVLSRRENLDKLIEMIDAPTETPCPT